MPFNLDGIKNGFATAQHVFTDWLTDKRSTNSDRPRISSQDPTAAIDKTEKVEILNFPTDRPKYYITFGFEEYRRPNQFQGLENRGVTDYICLPIPTNLQDTNLLNYSPESGSFTMEALTQAGRDLGGGITNSMLTGSVDSLVSGAGKALNTGGDAAIGQAIRTVISGAKAAESVVTLGGQSGKQSIVDGLLQMGGMADNPFNTIAFSGPNFKSHSFTWMLAPKSRAESEVIKRIVGTFKKAAYPELLTMAAGGFFKYPNIVWPKFQPPGAREFLYNFKPCVITSIDINYSPSNRPGFFGDTEAPIEVQIHLGLLEIEIWRNGDEKSLSNHQVPTIYSKDFAGIEGAPLQARDVN